MSFRVLCLIVSFVVSSTAVAAAKLKPAPSPPPEAATAAVQVVASGYLGSDKHPLPRNLIEGKAVLYSQEFGGAGVAGGLLLGPFGVLANVKAISSRTQADVAAMKGKLTLDPEALLERALDGRTMATGSEQPNTLRLSPLLYFTKNEGGELLPRVVLDAALGDWKGRYIVTLPDRDKVTEVAAGLPSERMAQLEESCVHGFARALDLLTRDARGELGVDTFRKGQIEVLNPRTNFTGMYQQVLDADGRLVFRSADIWSNPKNDNHVGGGVISVAAGEFVAK